MFSNRFKWNPDVWVDTFDGPPRLSDSTELAEVPTQRQTLIFKSGLEPRFLRHAQDTEFIEVQYQP